MPSDCVREGGGRGLGRNPRTVAPAIVAPVPVQLQYAEILRREGPVLDHHPGLCRSPRNPLGILGGWGGGGQPPMPPSSRAATPSHASGTASWPSRSAGQGLTYGGGVGFEEGISPLGGLDHPWISVKTCSRLKRRMDQLARPFLCGKPKDP